jgi:ribosomal protein S18 acetylase RimI-like enzyme
MSVREFQERAARGLPAAEVTDAGGWWLRHAPGCSWWVGTVLAHGDGDLARGITAAEEFYAERGLPARFQVSPASPAGLDAALGERGYRLDGRMSLRTAPIERIAREADVTVAEASTDAWFATWHAVHGGDPDAERALLDRIALPTAYASVVLDGAVVAVGRAVLDTGVAGVFGMATLPAARGRGAAGAVLAGLAGWAADRGATGLYLQVEKDNAAALRVYDRAGFTEVCEYHYRAMS